MEGRGVSGFLSCSLKTWGEALVGSTEEMETERSNSRAGDVAIVCFVLRPEVRRCFLLRG